MATVVANNLLGIENIQIYAQTALKELIAQAPLFTAFSTDFSPDGAGYGASVIVPILNNSRTTLNDTNVTPYAAFAATSSTATVTLGQKDMTEAFSELKWTNINPATINNSLIPNLVSQFVDLVATDVLSVLTGSTYTNATYTLAAGAFSGSAVNHISQLMSTAKIPVSGRTLLVKPTYYETLANSALSLLTPVATDVNLNYQISQGYGFKNIFSYPNLNANNTNLGAVGLIPSAIAFASRPVPEINVPGFMVSATATDPSSGLSIQLRNWWQDGQYKLAVTMCYGYAAGQVKAAILAGSTASI